MPLVAATSRTKSTSTRLAAMFSGVKRGTTDLKSPWPETGIPVDRPGKKAFAQRAERHKAHAQLREHRKQLLLRLAPEHRIFALNGRQRQFGMSTADGLNPRFGKPPMQHFPFAHRSPTVPATSSIGTSGSTRCW